MMNNWHIAQLFCITCNLSISPYLHACPASFLDDDLCVTPTQLGSVPQWHATAMALQGMPHSGRIGEGPQSNRRPCLGHASGVTASSDQKQRYKIRAFDLTLIAGVLRW
jgi:hypothetical protein